MFNSNNTPFTMPVMPATGGYSDGGAWGDGGWLWIIVVFALLFGWGNNGFGGFGGNNGGGYVATAATQADIQRGFDNSAVISKLDGISNGLCDGFYAMNNSMLRSGMSRKTYMESKELHRANTQHDKEAKMRDLEKYMKDLSEDVTDMLGDMTPEERSMIKAKMSTLVSKM